WALSRTPPHLRWLGHRGSGGSGGLLAERCWGPPGFYCAVAIGFGGASWASRLHSGGYANVLMPAYAGIALLAGLGYGAMSQRRAWAGPRAGPGAGPGAGRPWGALAGLGAAGLVVAQLALVRYPIAAQIPTTADAHAGARLMAEIKALPGQVVVLVHPWYGTLAGKGNFADVEALHDVLRAGPSKARADLRANLAVALESPRIGAVILDSPGNEEGIRSDLLSHFRQVPMTWHPGNAFYPVVGDLEARPGLLFVRRGLPAKGPGR
ncbi:MAG: hypothetical protein ACRDZQ_10065, partial [Acidimicrobiales bacterium]